MSCQTFSQEKYIETFDTPLAKENEELRLKGDYKAIMVLNTQYLNRAYKDNYDGGKALCYINIAFVNTTSGNYKQALFLLNKAEEALKNSDNMVHKAKLYNGFSELNNITGLIDNALDYNTKALYAIRKAEDGEMKNYYLSVLYIKRGGFIMRAKQNDSALVYFQKSRNIGKLALTESLIAGIYMSSNKLDSASVYIQNALQLIKKEKAEDNAKGGQVYFVAGNYYNRAGQYTKAEEAYQKALKINSETKQVFGPYFSSLIYESLAKMYEKAGDEKKEQFYHSQYLEEKNKYYTNQNEALNLLTEKFIDDIRENDKSEKRNVWISIGLLLIIMVTSVIYGVFKIKSLQNKKKILLQRNQELEEQTGDNRFAEVVDLAKKNDSLFLVKFQELYPDFVDQLLAINPKLEKSEINFCALIKLNFTSKEISTYLFIQYESVLQRKRRVRKKLNIPSEIDIYMFFNNL
ncbi:tetratricopeptide repeat protein [Elizabethkingia meningoseptica]|uniref:tetratricopeptide repeat protein n=1 Tax=Elizabethkingia meningoseptica TaxID=238 RepID=UPI0038924027